MMKKSLLLFFMGLWIMSAGAQDTLSRKSFAHFRISAGFIHSYYFKSLYGDNEFFNRQRLINPGFEGGVETMVFGGKKFRLLSGLFYAHYDYVMIRDVTDKNRHLTYFLHQWADRVYLPLYMDMRLSKRFGLRLASGIRINLWTFERYHYYIIDTGVKVYEDFKTPENHKILRSKLSLSLGLEKKFNRYWSGFIYWEGTSTDNIILGIKYRIR